MPPTVEVTAVAAGAASAPAPPPPPPPPPPAATKAAAPHPAAAAAASSSLLHHHHSGTAAAAGGYRQGHAPGGGSAALPTPILRRVVRVDAAGVVSHVLVDRYVLSEQLGLPFRDLRVLDPKTPSATGSPASTLPAAAILIRERALGFAVEGVRAIVCADQVLVLGAPLGREGSDGVAPARASGGLVPPPTALLPQPSHPSKHPHAALAASPFVRDLCARIKEDRSGGGNESCSSAPPGGEAGAAGVAGAAAAPASPTTTSPPPSASSAPLPYELRATEAVLLAAVRRLDGEVGALEAGAGPDLDALGGALGRDDLVRLRSHKASLGRLLARAAGLRSALESLLDDDSDLANLYLGRRAARAAALAAATAAAEREGVVEEEEEGEEGEEGGGQGETKEEEAGGGGGGKEAEVETGRRASSTAGGTRLSSSEAPPSGGEAPPPAPAGAAGASLLPRADTAPRRRATGAGGGGADTARGTDCGSEAGTAVAVWARGPGGGAWFGNAAARGGGGGHPHGGAAASWLEECEGAANLLDAYATLAGGSLARLEALRDRVASSEALVRLELDRRRNELVAFNMFLSMVSVCVGVVSAIGSVFGQNLYFSSHETPLSAWHAATWGSVGAAGVSMAGLLAYARRHNLLFIPTPDE